MEGIALVVLDVQDGLLKVIGRSEELLKRCALAIESAALLGMKVIYTEQSPEKLQGTNKSLMEAGLSKGKAFSKKAFSAFGAEGFLDYLRKEGVEHILIAGLEMSVCVYQTITDALRLNFEVTLLSDCVGGRREEDAWAIVAYLQNSKCHRLPCETVFYSLMQTAEHLDFKPFINIVKKYS